MIKYPLNVTIDTNIFEANKFDFGTDSTMSLLVKNVQNGKIKLILSNIVIREVEKHICGCVDNICGKARNLRKEYLDILPEQYLVDIGMGLYIQIPDKKTIHQSAKDVFAKFLEDCKVERLDAGNIDLEKILEDYFEVHPPFENSEKKRKEFPDAFIAAEIKKRFGSDEIVAIVSQDNGFIKACTSSENHLFFSSLGELFDMINKNEEEYATAVEIIKKNNDSIIHAIKRMIDDSCVEVYGLSHDKDGIIDGYDYDDTYLESCNLSGMGLHTIDDIDGDIITASLWIHGNMTVNCYFKDFNNAAWDSEEKEYIFVEERHILETHKARFACRIELNSKTKEIRVFPFKIVLGVDSRESREEIYDDQEDFYDEFEDADREERGFLPLSQYRNKLENDLNESSMAQAIVQIFKQYNDIASRYGQLATLYDEVCAKVNSEMEEDDAKAFINALSYEKNIPIDFAEKGIDTLLDEIREWLNSKLIMVYERMEQTLQDYIEYGNDISILGTKCKVYTLSFDELNITPAPGSEEQIGVSLLLDKAIVAKGHVKLTVGYLNLDEDGGAADGIGDSVDYEVDDVLQALKNMISDLEEEFNNEQKLAESIGRCLSQKNE